MPDIFYTPQEKQDREDMDNASAADWYKGQYGHGEPVELGKEAIWSISFSPEAIKQRKEEQARIYDRYQRFIGKKPK